MWETVIFIIRRLINALFTLFLLIVIIFILIHIIAPTPEALARIYASSPHVPPQALQAIIQKYGLNKPLYVQILNYIWDLLHGNFGFDPIYKAPELIVIMKFLPITLELVIPATVLAVILGILTGAIAAANRNKPIDYIVRGVYLATWAAPPFFVAIVLQLIVAYYLHLLPPYGLFNPSLTSPKDITSFPLINGIITGDWPFVMSMIRHMVLPMITLAIVSFGIVTRITRATMIDYMESDFARLSIMKGLPRRKVVYGVVLRNAAIPIVTLIALLFGYSVAGAVVIEEIFQYEGMGYFITQAIFNLDYIAILATTIIIGISIILANLVADILYGILDPRVRLS